MNKNKKNRKGFTIVELVIVIAVIGILATVLVPTFSGVITDAKKSAAVQEAKNDYTNYMANVDYATETPVQNMWIKVDNYYVQVVNGGVDANSATTDQPAECYTISDAGVLSDKIVKP